MILIACLSFHKKELGWRHPSFKVHYYVPETCLNLKLHLVFPNACLDGDRFQMLLWRPVFNPKRPTAPTPLLCSTEGIFIRADQFKQAPQTAHNSAYCKEPFPRYKVFDVVKPTTKQPASILWVEQTMQFEILKYLIGKPRTQPAPRTVGQNLHLTVR